MLLFYKFLAFFKRDCHEAMSFKVSFLIDIVSVTGQAVIFLYLGRFVDNYMKAGGASFGSFLLIGVALAGYQSTALQSFSLALHREMGNGTLEAVLMTPTSPFAVVASAVFWNFFMTSGKILLYFIAGIFILKIPLRNVNFEATLLGLFLTLTSLAGIGMISAAYTLVYKRGDPILFFLNGLTRIFSGVYFPLSVLPSWLGKISPVLPLTASLTVIRGAVLDGKSVNQLSAGFLTLAGFTLGLLPLGLWLFQRAVVKAKRDGSLSFPD